MLSCEGVNELPSVIEFNNLHLTDSFKESKETLSDLCGVYCIKCLKTGAMNIGNSIEIGERLMSHVFNYASNIHLQRAIALYGLPVLY